jgi:hypothetical protein
LPEFFGAVSTAIRAASDEAYRALIAEAMSFYRTKLFNAHWGEKIYFGSDNTLDIGMLFQGPTRQQVENAWAPFFGWVRARKEYSFTRQPLVLAVPAQRFWDPQYMNAQVPGVVLRDDREGAPPYRAFLKDNQYEAGQLLHGASVEEIASARDTATNPQVLDAFALVIIGGAGPAAYPGIPGPPPDLVRARDAAARTTKAMKELLKIAPDRARTFPRVIISRLTGRQLSGGRIIADEDVGGLLESLMGVAFRTGAVRLVSSPREPALRKARVCYDHLAGELGVLAYDSLIRNDRLEVSPQGLCPSAHGLQWFKNAGIDTDLAERQRRTFCRACMDWSERRYHLAGSLGAALLSRVCDLGWAKPEKASRVVRFTANGERQFRYLVNAKAPRPSPVSGC